MRRYLLIVLFIAGACNVWAQKQQPERISSINAPVNIASAEIKKSFTPPADVNLKSGAVLKSDFQVEFVNFPENAKAAFLYAVSIYENLISSPVPIKVEANWETLGTNVLAKSSPSVFYKNFDGARLADVYYPVALAEKLSEEELNGSEPDIVCSFNKNISWYYGTNGNGPSNQYDFVTIVLHELVHGLGFSGFFNVESGQGNIDNSGNVPSVYDVYIFNNQNQLADKSQFAMPSVQLKNALESGALSLKGNNNNEIEKIYSPSKWNIGTSIYHYNESGFEANDANALMSPFVFKGEAIHYPGDKTLQVLAELGWKSMSFDGLEIKDFEEPVAELPVWVEISSELDVDNSSVAIVFSTDNFNTSKSVSLKYNNSNNLFEGNIPLNGAKGKVQYYYAANTTDDVAFSCPSQAPDKKFSFVIGPDYYPPVLKHNPSKLLTTVHPVLDLAANASDNVGIATVQVEYKINGEVQELQALKLNGPDLYTGQVEFPTGLTETDNVEYRILAIDNTARGNKRYLPTSGYFPVEVFESQTPVAGYVNDFDSYTTDFEVSDFEFSRPLGFSSGNLHTVSPYPQSDVENEKYNLVAQLKFPIILQENGEMSFDEVVLVEPGEEGTIYTEENFWDFVIVEGSKNNGKSWLPITEGYDSNVDQLWSSHFTSTLKSAVSEAVGQENMFLRQTINLTENTPFEAGDTVIFRFRLASDKAVTGWGWAIDNLNIQGVATGIEDELANEDVSIYPNPFDRSIFVEGLETDASDIEIIVTDLYGKIIHRETRNDAAYSQKLRVDLPDVAPGIYMACVTDNNSISINQKIIKN